MEEGSTHSPAGTEQLCEDEGKSSTHQLVSGEAGMGKCVASVVPCQ